MSDRYTNVMAPQSGWFGWRAPMFWQPLPTHTPLVCTIPNCSICWAMFLDVRPATLGLDER